VVGVVRDVRTGLEKEAPLTVYQPFYWMPDLARQFFVVRTSIAPASTITAVPSVFRSMDPDLPLTRPATMPEIFDEALAARRFQMSLAVGFAGLGLILAGIGIYVVISFTVVQRTSELGIRLALGARASDVASMVLVQGMIPVFAGLFSGLAIALMLGRFFASQLYGISPYDPGTVAAASVVLLMVAVLACWVPARRAMRIDPVTALRVE
jgi:putative ABC transport system permease protein